MSNRPLQQLLKELFDKSLQTSLAEYGSDANWSYSNINKSNITDSEQAVFLTICSHQFRVFITIHFVLEKCRSFIQQALNDKKETIDEKASYDFLLELSNSICGMLKRELGNAVPALGMSTPNILDEASFQFIDIFKAEDTYFQEIKLDGNHIFYAGFYYCPNVENEIEVTVIEPEVEVDSGELELF
ncbi:hypothetical protein FLL45_14960 [Aliikangiella marina]|uniref:Chemotaxis phosphatase CheX-like domain-containing protein n=1 Tax=Aliikangiella marina TaxID=1712262 RepID=A0A545T6B4_9GAMM|nr:hypothetical protein [Aliikangiella marina]TQV72769.1 hypothetical protein FLL45_14960 [Aliikangiella marina]